MSTNLPTKGQIERTLSQHIQSLYKNHLGHQPSKVTCELFADKLAIVLEDSLTTAERVGNRKRAKRFGRASTLRFRRRI
jgi:uncharacterized protein YbcI